MRLQMTLTVIHAGNFLKLQAPGTIPDAHGPFNPTAVAENSFVLHLSILLLHCEPKVKRVWDATVTVKNINRPEPCSKGGTWHFERYEKSREILYIADPGDDNETKPVDVGARLGFCTHPQELVCF